MNGGEAFLGIRMNSATGGFLSRYWRYRIMPIGGERLQMDFGGIGHFGIDGIEGSPSLYHTCCFGLCLEMVWSRTKGLLASDCADSHSTGSDPILVASTFGRVSPNINDKGTNSQC